MNVILIMFASTYKCNFLCFLFFNFCLFMGRKPFGSGNLNLSIFTRRGSSQSLSAPAVLKYEKVSDL